MKKESEGKLKEILDESNSELDKEFMEENGRAYIPVLIGFFLFTLSGVLSIILGKLLVFAVSLSIVSGFIFLALMYAYISTRKAIKDKKYLDKIRCFTIYTKDTKDTDVT